VLEFFAAWTMAKVRPHLRNIERDGLTLEEDALCKPPGYVAGSVWSACESAENRFFLDIPKKRGDRGKLCGHWKSRRNAELVGRTYGYGV